MQITTDYWSVGERTEALRKAYLHEGSVEISFYDRMSTSRFPERQVVMKLNQMQLFISQARASFLRGEGEHYRARELQDIHSGPRSSGNTHEEAVGSAATGDPG